MAIFIQNLRIGIICKKATLKNSVNKVSFKNHLVPLTILINTLWAV